jgi:hypothetical protein
MQRQPGQHHSCSCDVEQSEGTDLSAAENHVRSRVPGTYKKTNQSGAKKTLLNITAIQL